MISPFTDLRVGLSPNSSHETERDICGGTPRKDFIPQEVEQTSLLIVFSLEFKGDGWSCSSHFEHTRHKLEDEKLTC